MSKPKCDEANSKPLVWDDNFSVHANILDRQHKSLFQIINLLRSACMNGLPKPEMLTIISDLYKYSASHFADEEALLKKKNYSRLEEQQVQHAIFLDYIIDLEAKVKGDVEDVNAEVLTFLNVWWEEHILKIDKQYSNII